MDKTFPLTETQLGMYLEWNADRASTKYNICLENRFDAAIDTDRLVAAVKQVSETYCAYRLRFTEVNGEVCQYEDSNFRLEVGRHVMEESETEAFLESFRRPFNPFKEPMIRAAVVTTPKSVILYTDIFHLISDGTGIRGFLGAIGEAYAGHPLPPEEFTFADYATLEPRLFETADYAAAREDHLRRFSGKTMSVPSDPDGSDTPSADEPTHISDWFSRAEIEAFCREHKVHPNLFFMGAFARTLALFTNQREVVFFTANHGRRDPRIATTHGAFVKTVPCLASLRAEMSLVDFLNSLKLHRAGVYPFTHFCRDTGITPGIGFVMQDGTVDLGVHLEVGDSKMRRCSAGGVGTSPIFEVYGERDRYELRMSAVTGAYTEKWLRAFLERASQIVRNFLAHPEARLGDIPVVSESEEADLLSVSNGGKLVYDREMTATRKFAEVAAERTTARALVDCERSLTYGEAEALIGSLADELTAAGVVPDGFVGVMLPRRVSFAVSALAIQRCGSGYVPIDPEYPADRIDYMLGNSEAKVLITTKALLTGMKLAFDGKVIFFEDVQPSGKSIPDRSSPDTPAYMIYTSGSTGRPKGVVLPNRALYALCAWTVSLLGLERETRVGATPSFSFDASVMDLFPILTIGGELHIFSETLRKDLSGMRDYIDAQGIAQCTMSTQLGLALVNAYPEVKLKTLMLGGEKLVPFAKTAVKVFNGYGPTEFSVCSSAHPVDQSVSGEIPIGRPSPNSSDFVCDPLGCLVPRGMIGELCLAGVQIANGYWRLEEKTDSVFVKCPYDVAGSDGRMYRTGDFACWNADGELEYRGRIDAQVKLRGFRIEIGEIEHVAAACDGVNAVIATVTEIAGVQHLVLYYTGSADREVVRAKMSETLTGYMVPDYFVCLKEMPMTPGGKIDRKALPVPNLSDEPAEEPKGELEAKALEILRAIIKSDTIGVTHDFNRIGLTSLGAMAFVARLRKDCSLSVSLSYLADHPTVRLLVAEADAKSAPAAAKVRRPKRATYPISENQRGVYADWLRNPGATQYNVPVAVKFPGLDASALASAVEKVIDAHCALKTRFAEKDGEIVQVRRDEAKIPVTVEKLDFEPETDFFTAKMRPFAVADEDLVRAMVFASSSAAWLFLDVHHIVFDGISVGVFISELERTLAGGEPTGEAESAFDAALEERDYLESELLAEDDVWFDAYLDGCESTRVETSLGDTGEVAGKAARVTVKVPAADYTRRCGQLGVSASDYFLAAFMETLRRTGRSDDVQITFVSAGRAKAELADTIGMFVRTLPVRNVKDEATFSGTVTKLHRKVLELIDRDRCSYARLAERNGLTPEIIFAFEGGLFELKNGAELVPVATGTAKFPLSVTVMPGADDFELAFEYDTSLYSERDMRALLEMFRTLSERALVCDELKAIPLVSDEEAAQLVDLAYGGPIEYDDTRTFVDMFRANAIANPIAVAVCDCEGELTYSEVDARSDALAAELVQLGVKPGGFVGIMLPRRASFVVALLAVQKCGAGYVPMDSEYPADRLAYMLQDSASPVLITTRSLFDGKGLAFAGEKIFIESVSPVEGTRFTSLATPNTPAYMIYTSGSTGRPKGVVLPNRALRHLLSWTVRDRKLDYQSRVIVHASFSFDASVIDLFPVLSAGGQLHVLRGSIRKDLAAIRDYIVEHGITGATMPTQVGMALVDSYPDIPLKDIMFGGEKLMPMAKTSVRLMNGYGPTEFCVCSSYQDVDQSADGDIPIGRAVAGTWSFIVDRYGHLLPRGYAGEIALAGPQIAEGYWQRPDKTASVFVQGPFVPPSEFDTSRSAFRLYRTGDLARYDDEGRLVYLGRLDFQVKLRGFRIEIGEVEHAAATFSGVGAVAAEVRDVAGAKHLVLYYAAEGDVDEAKLRDKMSESLTAYMVPDYFVRLDEMPMTPGGKINRKLLPAPSTESAVREYVEPKAGAEHTIAEVWAKILKLDRMGATDDFFAAGGTSMLGIKAVVALQKQGLDVQYGDLFKYKTPRKLAAFLSGEESTASVEESGGFDYSAYDYSRINQLLAKTRTDLFDGFRVHSLGDVLLTGATGYLGIHVLRYLLENTSSSVMVLIRPKGKAGAERRLASQYVYYFGERMPRRFIDRVSYIEGDITDADLDTKLASVDATTVINCAALVKHFVADDLMDRINIGGVRNLIAWCEKSGARLVHTSTYSVGGMISVADPAMLDERRLFVGQNSDNDYIRTKFTAERDVLEAVASGKVRAKIMRLGNLMGRESDGEFQMNVGANAFVNSLKSYKAIGAFPLEELAASIEMSPIDRVAEAVCLLATTPDDMCVFHPYNAYALDLGAVLGAMNRRGYNVDFTSRGDFAAHVDALRNDPARAKDLQGILHYAQRHLGEKKVTPVTNAWTTTVLYRLGFRWKPAEDSYLSNFFDVLDGMAVFG